MLNERDVYQVFRKASGKPYKMPKDWKKKWNSFKPEEREALRKMVRLLATTWQDVNLENYFQCGYELWKGFWFNKWFKPELFSLYVQKSKNKKRIEENVKRVVTDSFKFVLQYCIENNIKSLNVYSRLRDEQKLIIMEHFLQDKISKWFLVLMVQRRFCLLNEADLDKFPFDAEKIREMKVELREHFHFTQMLEQEFIKKLEASL